MKTLPIITALALLPISSFANVYNPFSDNIFIEYGVSLFSINSSEYELNDITVMEEDSSDFNGNGMIYAGMEYNGYQFGFAPEYSETDTTEMFALNVRAVFPFTSGKFQPYASLEIGFANLMYDDGELQFDDYAALYGIGAGIRYNITEKTNIKLGLEYQAMLFETDIDAYTYKVTTSGFSVVSSIGYRF